MKRLPIVVLVLVGAAIVVALLAKRSTTPSAAQSIEANQSDESAALSANTTVAKKEAQAPTANATPSAPSTLSTDTNSAALTPQEEAAWRASLPTKQQTKEEAAKDPHSAPKNLTDLAPGFAKMIEDSRTSLPAAQKAFAKFAICAQDSENSYVLSLRVSCLTNAKKVAAMYPERLDEDLSKLNKTIDPQTSELARAYEAL